MPKSKGKTAITSYNVLKSTESSHQLIPFIRYEHFDTHMTVVDGETRNDAYNVNEIVFGLGWKPAEGAIFKIDTRMRKTMADGSYSPYLNAGIGVWF